MAESTQKTDIRKPPNDRKEYRVVKLDNGLVALLIEDHLGQSRAKKRSRSNMSVNFSDNDSEDNSGSTSGGDLDSSDVTASDDSRGGDFYSSSDRSQRGRKGEKVKRKSKDICGDLDPDDMSSACGLCVNVGSFSDPFDVPGMAHLLEHMVFMGSDKYPGDNALDILTNRYGGYDNAFTDYERTVFTVSIHNKHLKEALDMFAHFFASPQLLKESLNREIEAVDSEFQTSMQKDSARLMQLLCTIAKPGHPYSKFVWGNAISLKKNLQRSGINLCERLREFSKRMYSSHYMTLVVHSSDSLDKLEEFVRKSFSNIPKNELPCPDFSSEDPPFDERTYNKLIKVVPVKETQEIQLTWCLPSLQKYYRTKPLNYLGFLLGHEGKGSILSYLKKRNLAISIDAGNTGTGYEFNSCFSLFTCSITLTDKGFSNIDQCILVVFQYLKMLQIMGPQERIFRENQTIEENAFNFQDDEEPVDNVEKLCENMQVYPQEEYLTGDDLLPEYNPECITMVTDLLTPDRVNFMWLSKNFSSECNTQEKWFGVNYSVHDIPEAWICKDIETNPELSFPVENIYIATDFKLVEEHFTSDFPVLLDQSDHFKVWYKPDNIFENHKAWIGLVFDTPIHTESAVNAVLMDIFVDLYSHVTAEQTYAADMAGLEYSIDSNHRGLTLSVTGFSHKLDMFSKNLIDYIINFTLVNLEADFLTIKEQLKRSYHNHLLKPKKLCKMNRFKVLKHRCWNTLDKVDIVDYITLSQLNDFLLQFKRNMYVEALMQGNITKKVAIDIMKHVCKSFNLQKNPPSALIPPRAVQLPSNTVVSYCTANRDSGSPNSVLTDYYQCCALTDRDMLMAEVAVALMDEPCFDTLRTKKQLGYEVYCEVLLTHGVLGLLLTLVSQTNKHSVDYASKCMEKFVKKFSTGLSSLKRSEFDAQMNSLIQQKLEPDFALEKEVDRNWNEIINKWYKFDRLLVETEMLKSITQGDVCDWLQRYTLSGEHYRKLTTKVISGSSQGHGDRKGNKNIIHLSPEKLETFKAGLFLYHNL